MSGLWVFVCGPSGAGKDSVMAWAQAHLAHRPDIVFAQRIVTRATQAGMSDKAVTPSEFDALRQSGGLAWHWSTHGLDYGISTDYARRVQAGAKVVVNGSRGHVQDLPAAENRRVVQVLADPQVLAERLTLRARESPDAVSTRLSRNALFDAFAADHTVVNQGVLAAAGSQLMDYLSGCLPVRSGAPRV